MECADHFTLGGVCDRDEKKRLRLHLILDHSGRCVFVIRSRTGGLSPHPSHGRQTPAMLVRLIGNKAALLSWPCYFFQV